MALTAAEISSLLESEGVHFLRLQFTDILGMRKNVEVPASQFEKALAGEIMFDGSSVQGFTRIEESDMLLKPDYSTFVIMPDSVEGMGEGRVARLICDIALPDDTPFPGDPRLVLRKQVERLQALGFDDMFVGPEPEFFLFERDERGAPTTITGDAAGYFDLAPIDKGEDARRDMVDALVEMGFEIETAHHEVAPGQHEIDFKYATAIETADAIVTFKTVVKRIAMNHGLHATFMPKPVAGISGSGMHTHLSLFRDGRNAFYDEDAPYGLSQMALGWIAGLLEHSPGMVAITNPIVNSYKRLTPGYEAPTNIAWSAANRSAMIRVPARRGVGTRCELRSPDPACNPYLAFALLLAAGLKGIEEGYELPDEYEENTFELTPAERAAHRIERLPSSLGEALQVMEASELVADTLGEHLFSYFLANKRQEWEEYTAHVTQFEIERYLPLL